MGIVPTEVVPNELVLLEFFPNGVSLSVEVPWLVEVTTVVQEKEFVATLYQRHQERSQYALV